MRLGSEGEADYLASFGAEIQNDWSYSSIASPVFVV
jgi:hypothetical protein